MPVRPPGAVLNMVWLCGVDGFKDRWRAVLGNFTTGEVLLVDLSLKDLLALPEIPAIIGVDVPIGLPQVTLPGGRTCDRLARRLLGPCHGSVFSPMGRMCLQVDNREKASQLSIDRGGIGIGVQSWGLRKSSRKSTASCHLRSSESCMRSIPRYRSAR